MPVFKKQFSLLSAADLVPLLDDLSVQLAWSERHRFQIELALEELIVNTFTHGKSQEQASLTEAIAIDMKIQQDGADLTITLKDNAIAFDPTLFVPPDVTLSAEDRQIGGLGLFLTSKMMDTIHYKRDGSFNHVEMHKHLS